jgi:hypothetical protein
VIFRSKAAEEAPFSSNIILGTGERLLLRGAMPEDRLNSNVHKKLEGKKMLRPILLSTLIERRFHPHRRYLTASYYFIRKMKATAPCTQAPALI